MLYNHIEKNEEYSYVLKNVSICHIIGHYSYLRARECVYITRYNQYYSIYVVNIECIISNINITIENNIIFLVLFIYRVQCNLISGQYEQAYLFVGQVFNVK